MRHPSSKNLFNIKPFFFEFPNEQFPMVSLNFDNPVFNGSPAAAPGLEPTGQLRKRLVIKRDSRYQADPLPLASLGFAANTHNPVARRCRRALPASAIAAGFTAFFTYFAFFRRIHKAAVVILVFVHTASFSFDQRSISIIWKLPCAWDHLPEPDGI
jgi:hypothetical protein